MNISLLKIGVLIGAAIFFTACGGGGGGSTTAATSSVPAEEPGSSSETGGSIGKKGETISYNVPAVAEGSAVTTISLDNYTASEQTDIPFTFGQVFAPGALPSGTPIMMRHAEGAKVILPTQIDVKASHVDGSIRHAIVSARVPSIPANSKQNFELVVVDSSISGKAISLADILGSGFDSVVTLRLGGKDYSASAADQLAGTKVKAWLQGPQVTEWITSAPLKDSGGVEHPHLTARFNVRAYATFDTVRVDVVIENNWAYESDPQNFIYDTAVSVCGKNVYNKSNLTHYTRARWRKTFWCGVKPQVHISHDVDYLISTGAMPNYDQRLVVPESNLNDMELNWTGVKTEPMGIGTAQSNMPGTGGRPDIGPLPRWVARYFISQDRRAKMVAIGNANLAGSWQIHYRDKTTDQPVSIDDYPYVTLKGSYNSSHNPSTGKYEAFPECASSGSCSSPNNPDSAHQPSFTYVPYMLTGDYYFLEELLFWANYNIIQANPNAREHKLGLVQWEQVRGQAWSMRSLGHAAYISPDDHPMKSYFIKMVNNNLDYYNARYTDNASAPALGFITNGGAIKNDGGGPGQLSPWNDDALTMVTDWLVGMGFTKAVPFRNWKVKFVYGRFSNHPVFCKQDATPYRLVVQYKYGSGPVIDNWAEMLSARFPDHVGNCPTEFDGSPKNPESYLSISRGALAAAVAAGYQGASVFFDEVVSVQNAAGVNFNSTPQWAIMPRK